MMVAAGFDHANDELGTARTEPAATGEPSSFELSGGTEVLYMPGDPDYHEVIERPTSSLPSGSGTDYRSWLRSRSGGPAAAGAVKSLCNQRGRVTWLFVT